ncbi:MAG: hypothetical protein J7J98_07630 [candidate division Zixibacteria bacterium]|nr:hypothetical protein [candidate division Zixibacteria bacterium]
MAAPTLSLHMDEGGAYFVHIAFADENGDAKAPETLNWTLTTKDGQTIINNRKEEDIPSPTASEDVVLNNADCAVLSGETASKIIRLFTVQGTYNSTLGNGLKLRGQCYIPLDNYPALPTS